MPLDLAYPLEIAKRQLTIDRSPRIFLSPLVATRTASTAANTLGNLQASRS